MASIGDPLEPSREALEMLRRLNAQAASHGFGHDEAVREALHQLVTVVPFEVSALNEALWIPIHGRRPVAVELCQHFVQTTGQLAQLVRRQLHVRQVAVQNDIHSNACRDHRELDVAVDYRSQRLMKLNRAIAYVQRTTPTHDLRRAIGRFGIPPKVDNQLEDNRHFNPLPHTSLRAA